MRLASLTNSRAIKPVHSQKYLIVLPTHRFIDIVGYDQGRTYSRTIINDWSMDKLFFINKAIFFYGATAPIWALAYLHETLRFTSVF
jgi:hypothetical protein